LPKNAEKCQILAIFAIFGQNAGKTRFFGLLGLKWPFSGLFGPGAQGFYINPSGAPARGRGTLPGAWEPGDQGSRGPGGLGTSGIPDPGIPGSGEPPPARAGRPREAPGPVPAGPAYGVLHQPLAAAPRGSREGSGRPRKSRRGPAGLREASQEALGPPLPREGPPAGTAGGGAPTGGEGRIPSSFRRKGVRSRPVPAGASPSPVCYGEGKSTRRTPSKKPSALT